MKFSNVHIPAAASEPSRAHARLASVIWLLVSLPFAYLAVQYWNWPASVFAGPRGWLFATCALACVAIATVVPPRYRFAIVGIRVRGRFPLK